MKTIQSKLSAISAAIATLAFSGIAMAKDSTPAFSGIECGSVRVYVGQNSTRQTLQFQQGDADAEGVIDYLLTKNTKTILNRPYLIHGSTRSEAARDLTGELMLPGQSDVSLDDYSSLSVDELILSFVGTPVTTTDPVSPDNYTGSIAELNPGKQLRVTYNQPGQTLTVSLFDAQTGSEQANWIFDRCQIVNNNSQ